VLLVSVLQKLASFPGCSPAFATQSCGAAWKRGYIYMKQKLSQVRDTQQCMRLPVLLALLPALLTTAVTWGSLCSWMRSRERTKINSNFPRTAKQNWSCGSARKARALGSKCPH